MRWDSWKCVCGEDTTLVSSEVKGRVARNDKTIVGKRRVSRIVKGRGARNDKTIVEDETRASVKVKCRVARNDKTIVEDEATVSGEVEGRVARNDKAIVEDETTVTEKVKCRVARNDKIIVEDEIKKKMWDSVHSIRDDGWRKNHIVHVRTEPVIEVLSVTFCNQYDCLSDSHSNRIYGTIYVHEEGNMGLCDNCVLFKREYGVDDPEFIPLHGCALSLTASSVMSMDKPAIAFDIQDCVTGETIMKGSAPLFKTTDTAQPEHQFEQLRRITVPGTACSVEVEYLALTFGVFGCVTVQLSEKKVVRSVSNEEERSEGKEFDVYGTISATYNLYHYKDKVNCITLFEITEDLDVSNKVKLGSSISLSRSVVAVPAYSPLTIQVELWDRTKSELIVKGSCEFQACNAPKMKKIIPGGNCLDAEVTVSWREPFLLEELCSSAAYDPFTFISIPVQPNPEIVRVCPVVEVFSVIISCQSEEQFSLYGMVNFFGSNGLLNLFDRDKTDPLVLSPGCNLLSLKGPEIILIPGSSFYVSVDLEDVEGRVSIKGFVAPSSGLKHNIRAWHDRLLCTVVKGARDHSFAAVHYTVLSYAVQAMLKIRFQFNDEQISADDACCKIHGTVVAYYGELGCRTPYEKLYFRGFIFERAEENPLQMPCKDFDMELSRSAIGVPCDSFLRIVVDLSCRSSGTTRLIRDSKDFPVGSGVSTGVTIAGDEVSINITMEWWEPPYARIL